MAEAKDPEAAIKLFGKTIPLPDTPPAAPSSADIDDYGNNNNVSFTEEIDTPDKGNQERNSCQPKESEVPPQGADESACLDPSLKPSDISESLSAANENAVVEPSKSEEEKADTSVSHEKTLKKPDKILPCPRCNSMDTKFCYYNNYNVNQPRHFCRKCQRYWTAGGNMRNVPVGAGRRKNKSSSSHSRQITVPEALQNTIHSGAQTNGNVLTFGSDSPLCESMSLILNLAEKTVPNCPVSNGFTKPELKIQLPFVAMENGSQLNGSNLEDATKSSPKELPPQICLPYTNQIPCYPVAPWAYHWSSAQWTPPVAAPPFSLNGIALPYYPAPAVLGCTVPGTWSIPWIAQPSPAALLGTSSSPNSATLGKHSRNGNVLTTTNTDEKDSEDNNGGERSLWVPKTLRIDDPREAAKSSIWTTLGIKHSEKPGSIGRGSGLFKAFQSKCDERTPTLETSTALEANPAALSRSQNFQENT